MHTFSQKPKATQQAMPAKSAIPGRAHFGQNHTVNSILYLQRTIGNQAVQRLLQTSAEDIGKVSNSFRNPSQVLPRTAPETSASEHSWDMEGPEASKLDQQLQNKQTSAPVSTVVHHRDSFTASIRRTDKPRSSGNGSHFATGERSAIEPRFAARYHDAMPGNEQTSVINFESLLSQTQSARAQSISEPQEGETVQLPNIVLEAGIIELDAIASTLGYSHTITQSGITNPFGVCTPGTIVMSGINVTSSAGTFTVAATVDFPLTFQVNSGGKTDISSDSDPDITQANYGTVTSDLTPNMADLNGRPPRTQFWTEDLCIRHERFHADEAVAFGGSGVVLSQNWLNTQTASSVADVNNLLTQVPARVEATMLTGMAYPAREHRAYGDGAPVYLARANAIKAKGDRNEYAPPAPSPAP